MTMGRERGGSGYPPKLMTSFMNSPLLDNAMPTADVIHTSAQGCKAKLQMFQASGYDGKENPFFWGTTGRMTNR